MQSFLKKRESENFNLRFLNFSEIDSWSSLDNYTRIKSFILCNTFETSCSKWYKMYILIVEFLQKIRPLNHDFLLHLCPFKGRCAPFSEHRGAGYSLTDFGLYLRVPTSANEIIMSIKKILRIYGFDVKQAYLVIELNPDSVSPCCEDIVEREQSRLLNFLKKTYVGGDAYYEIAVAAINAMNDSIQQYSNTTYNNLYLLSESDYERYSNQAVELQLRNPKNTISRRELELTVLWLKYSKFYKGDYVYLTKKSRGLSFICDNEKRIVVNFNTTLYKEII